MRVKWFIICLVLSAAPGAWAAYADPPQPDAPAKGEPAAESGQQAYDTILAEYNQAMADFQSAYQDAQTDEAREKVFSEKYPQNDKYLGRFLEVAQKYPQAAVAFDALAWVINHGQGPKDTDVALELLIEHHLDNPQLGAVCQRLAYSVSDGAEKLLRAATNSSHHEVQGNATYSLASMIRQRVDMAEMLRDPANKENRAAYEQYYGAEAVEKILKVDAQAAATESEQLLEKVAADFSDVKSYRGSLADRAKADLFELKHLSIGQVAPEITGEDLDGTTFQISDYRGKVVVIDFWGNW